MNDRTTWPNLHCGKDAVSFGFLFSIVMHSLISIAKLVLVPLLLLPRCLRMFEEFGIVFPKRTRFAIAIGDFIVSIGLFHVIVAIPAVVAWQPVLFFLNGRRMGSKLAVADWILVSRTMVIRVISLGMALAAIVSGLNG